MELALAVLLLLLTPGPTNSLMLLSGAERGLAGALRLIPAELLGYFLTVLPLVAIGPAVLDDQPSLRMAVSLAAAVWVACLAMRLWHLPLQLGAGGSVNWRSLTATTVMNPKALIFGLVLLPSDERLTANLIMFAVMVVAVALFWAAMGAALQNGRGPRTLMLFRRLASVWLAVISVTLVMHGVGA